MQKAYERIQWAYLEAIMKKIGLCHSFIDQVMRGVKTVSFSVLFNGGRTREFVPTRGLGKVAPSLRIFFCWRQKACLPY